MRCFPLAQFGIRMRVGSPQFSGAASAGLKNAFWPHRNIEESGMC
jgi:hypothetical protein